MSRSNQPTIPDRIPADFSSHIEKGFIEQMDHDRFRKKVKEIFGECIKDIDFVTKIKEYAGQEIDIKIYKSMDFWLKTVIIPIVVTVLTALILKFTHLI